MKAKTLEFLNFLLWSVDQLVRPSVRNLSESYEAWAYRTGIWREVAILQKRDPLARCSSNPDERLYCLTEPGRLLALGGRDPEAYWRWRWDGLWRLVVFDVPNEQNTQRERLRRYLRARGYGCLQRSVWISPHPLEEERKALVGGKVNVASLILLEARPCVGETDAAIVAAAWDFELINFRYSLHPQVLERKPTPVLRGSEDARALQRWAAEEREAWFAAVSIDPLLPMELWPSSYQGKHAWNRRKEVLQDAGQQLRTFRSETVDQ